MPALRSAALPARSAGRPGSATGLQAAVTLVVSAVAGLALVASPDWWVAFGLVGVAGLTAYGLTHPAGFLALFLLVRPLLDQFSQATAGVPSANLAGVLGVFLVGITIVVLALRRTRFSVPGTIPLLAIAGTSVVAALQAQLEIGSVLETRSLSELVRLAALVAVFLLAAQVTTSIPKAKTLFVIVVLSSLVPAGYGLYEFFTGAPLKEAEGVARISGTFTGPVPFGAFLALTALITIFGPVQRIPGWVRWPALALMLFALLESYSRVGWVLFVLGLFILAWPRQKRLVAVALVGLAIALAASGDVRHRALPVGGEASSPQSQDSEGGYESYDWRIKNWGGLLDKAAEKPILGYGLKSTEFVNPRAPAEGIGVAGGGFGAHNTFIRVLVEGGVVLVLVYLAFFAFMIRRMWRLSRAPWALAEAARLLLVIWSLILFAGATTDDPLALTAVMVGLLAMTGALEGAWRLEGRSTRQPDPDVARAKSNAAAPFWHPAAPGGARSG